MTIREFELFTLAAAIMAFWDQLRSLLAWPVGMADEAMADDPAVAAMTPADLQEHLIQLALARRSGDAA